MQLFIGAAHGLYLPLALVGIPLRCLCRGSSSRLIDGMLRRVGKIGGLLTRLRGVDHISTTPKHLSLTSCRLSVFLGRAMTQVESCVDRGSVVLH